MSMGTVSFKAIHDEGGEERPRRPSIRDIQVTGARRSVRRMHAQQDYAAASTSGGSRRAKSPWFAWLLGGSFAFLAFAALFLVFSGKTAVALEGRATTVAISDNVVQSAYKNPQEDELPFVTFEKTATETVTLPATETKFVETKASGTLVVYNRFRSTPQRIIKNTRFEAPDGKIYRVRHSFVIPGYTKKPDGTIEPGKVEITVYADRPGEEYNKEKAKFTLPGLKGDPRYDKIWAETKTPLTGGFSGIRPVVAEDVLEKEQEKVKERLLQKLYQDFQESYGATHAVFREAIFPTFQVTQEPAEEGDAVALTVTAKGVLAAFPMTAFAETIARSVDQNLHPGQKRITNISDLTFNIIQKENIDPLEDEIIQFTLDGVARIEWVVDVEAIKEALAGKSKDEFNQIIGQFPEVANASLSIRPFWRSNFPSNPEKIEVTLEFPEN